jgi:hypothetical protein
MAADLEPVGSPRRNYRFHFGVAYFVLAALVGAAVGTFIVMVARPSAKEQSWSAWRPTGSQDERVQQITRHVATKYRLPSGNQLVAVLPQPPQVMNNSQPEPIRYFAFAKPSPTTGIPNITFRPADRSLEFIFCGQGSTDCAITEDKPTAERLRLLRREALELALYTFRYVDDVKSVFALLPPQKKGARPQLALYFTKQDVQPLLDRPLRRTLPQEHPPLADLIPRRDAQVIEQVTGPHFYRFTYQRVSDQSLVLVLEPIA